MLKKRINYSTKYKLNKKIHILYSILVYSITIVGSCWLIFIAITDFNQEVVNNKTTNKRVFPSELITASKLKAKGNTEAATALLTAFVEDKPNNYEGRLMLSELYFEECLKDTLNCDLALWNLTFLIKKFPHKKQPYLYRSDIYYKLGDTISAQRDLSTQFIK